jgi:D-tagatose-1,6-bisphosphate aldolase subunit GatZ/KbaZ
MRNPVLAIIAEHKAGAAKGAYSVCSAHPTVLESAARLAAGNGAPLLIESTCNQVNQDGGYTGMTPHDFAAYVGRVSLEAGLSRDEVVLGGDHLGPYPWRSRPADEAMQHACTLVADCVRAGYTKIHLDASMQCADDHGTALPMEVVAKRSAELCAAAEETYRGLPAGSGASLCYVIGTEVPSPGGATGANDEAAEIVITKPEDVEETLEVTGRLFAQRGLEGAWERVIALVVQPGVDFGNSGVREYERRKAESLSGLIVRHPRLVYEAHSTDFQSPGSLRELVEDHFAILKVGPALTFAFREAVFALAWVEREWLGGRPNAILSDLPAVLDRTMLANPTDWTSYYQGGNDEIALALRYSYSDRARYYWTRPEVQAALAQLFRSLQQDPPPLTLLSQFLPEQYKGVREGRLGLGVQEWISDRITAVLRTYAQACGQESTTC